MASFSNSPINTNGATVDVTSTLISGTTGRYARKVKASVILASGATEETRSDIQDYPLGTGITNAFVFSGPVLTVMSVEHTAADTGRATEPGTGWTPEVIARDPAAGSLVRPKDKKKP